MTVSNGQLANQTTFNSSFMSREIDTDTVGKVDLKNADALSGAYTINIQRIVNSIASALGITTSEVYDFLITWGSDIVGAPNDTVKARINAIVAKFAGTGGHTHDGTDGDGTKISATDLLNINKLFAEWQSYSITAITGSSTDVSSLFTSQNPNGSTVAEGVLTFDPYNKCPLYDPLTGQQFEDAGGQKVYGRLTWAAAVWTLSFYTNEAGTETAYSFGSSTDIQFFFLEVFNLANRPTIPSTPEFGSLDITADVADASPTQRGVVNTIAQIFSGQKEFNDGITIQTLLQLLITDDSVTTGSAQTVPTPDPLIILSNASLTSVGGFTSDTRSRQLIVINKTGASINLLHEDSGTTAIHRVSLPGAANLVWKQDQAFVFVYDNINNRWNLASGTGSPFILQAFGSTPNANGASYNSTTGNFNLQPASITHPGGVSTAQQRLAGMKGFDNAFGTLGVVDNTTTGTDATLSWSNGYVKLTDASLDSITMIDEPTEIATVLFLTNSTGNPVTLKNDNGATAAKRILTGTGADLIWETGQTLSLIYDQDSDRWRVSSGSGSGSGSGFAGKNYAPYNGRFESGINGWSVFNTTFTAGKPTTITSGSSNVTIAAETTNPLSDNKSIKFSITTAAGSAGHGMISDIMTIDDADLARGFQASMDYLITSGASFLDLTGLSTQTLEVWVYNVGLAFWYQPINFRGINASIPQTLVTAFNTDYDNTANKNQYRLAIIVRNDPAGSADILFDSVYFGRFASSLPTVNSPQVQVALTTTTAIPNTTYQKVALDTLVYDATGAWDATNFRFIAQEPGWYEISGSMGMSVGTGARVFFLYKNGVAVQTLNASVAISGSGYSGALPFCHEVECLVGDYLELWAYIDQGSAGNIVGGHSVNFKKLPDKKTASAFNEAVIFRAQDSATATITNTMSKVTFTGITTDNIQGHNSGTYTFKKAGYYNVAASLTIQGSGAVTGFNALSIRKNNTTDVATAYNRPTDTGPSGSFTINTQAAGVWFNVGDFVEVLCASSLTSPTLGLGISSAEFYFTIVEIPGAQKDISSKFIPRVYLYTSTNQGLAASTLTKLSLDTFGTDPLMTNVNGWFNTSTNRFTPQKAGIYRINFGIFIQGTNNRSFGVIVKNGVTQLAAAPSGGISGDVGMHGHLDIPMNGTTDYLEVYGFSFSSISTTMVASEPDTYFQAIWVSDL